MTCLSPTLVYLREIALEKAKNGVFTHPEVNCWVGGSAARQHSLLKRSMAAGEVLRIHRGLYCLANRFLASKPNPFVLAQRVYGPSYVSLESALSYHGWIPEAAYAVTSTSVNRSREFDTPLGLFSFASVPQKTLKGLPSGERTVYNKLLRSEHPHERVL
ncbi:MAG: hypothetical protein HYU36_22665 [Planctomycetes bacterium]|nr:hypothetical protein [Planctomycetota bacterium]